MRRMKQRGVDNLKVVHVGGELHSGNLVSLFLATLLI